MAAVRLPCVTAPGNLRLGERGVGRVGVVLQPFVGLYGVSRRNHKIRRNVARGVIEHKPLVACLPLCEIAA